ncbi:myosin heavy chain kinase [Reticulomyxa filosa]|uniref:Myosin heavy chain kinase n=1 Tax=Reticulomyxa filosa TaxID=46433 RepID=X6N4H9_RETFI|nr:myosin heavy chain kinase [Reticulomyxa filosa]|eukprot:ETO21200.1 myosin heavy chain kinase [Reticulomyxa filosa]
MAEKVNEYKNRDQKLRKLSMHSKYEIPAWIKEQDEHLQLLSRNDDLSKMEHSNCQPIVLQKQVPNWSEIAWQPAIRFDWDNTWLTWTERPIQVKIAKYPFGQGSLRASYYCLINDSKVNLCIFYTSKPLYYNSTIVSSNKTICIYAYYTYANLKIKLNKQSGQTATMKEKEKGKRNQIRHESLLKPTSFPNGANAHGQFISHSLGSESNLDDFFETDEIENENEKGKETGKGQEKKTKMKMKAKAKEKDLYHQSKLLKQFLGIDFMDELKVAKKNIEEKEKSERPWFDITSYFNDVRTQSEAQRFAAEYNGYNPPKKIAFLATSVILLQDQTLDVKDRFYCVEEYLHGSYVKHLDNHGGDEQLRNTPAAFAHFTYEASNNQLLVCDIQGVGDLYTDPQIHTIDGRGFGRGNLGIDGMLRFLRTHQCNAICQHLKLQPFNPHPFVDGTIPIKRKMDLERVRPIEPPSRNALSASALLPSSVANSFKNTLTSTVSETKSTVLTTTIATASNLDHVNTPQYSCPHHYCLPPSSNPHLAASKHPDERLLPVLNDAQKYPFFVVVVVFVHFVLFVILQNLFQVRIHNISKFGRFLNRHIFCGLFVSICFIFWVVCFFWLARDIFFVYFFCQIAFLRYCFLNCLTKTANIVTKIKNNCYFIKIVLLSN